MTHQISRSFHTFPESCPIPAEAPPVFPQPLLQSSGTVGKQTASLKAIRLFAEAFFRIISICAAAFGPRYKFLYQRITATSFFEKEAVVSNNLSSLPVVFPKIIFLQFHILIIRFFQNLLLIWKFQQMVCFMKLVISGIHKILFTLWLTVVTV